ncbi:DUF6525 family protein [Thalassococcus sp. S3]|uniref:DUF6525 family protein n=1 Tax=Thalassococcus sp. S3 TaxID=2017482 RepID=UPI0010245EFC|nr:DUF6525 family protein [Thalassococcus sp. S3]QBF30093.1 hypothetical protein CFI11_02520 [Thalassococcus sp. S3]
MTGNLGATSLRRRRRPGQSMQTYDTLPAPIRQWLSQAALPWSPASARKIWMRARAKGMSAEEAITTLSQAEARSLKRDRWAVERDPIVQT